MELGIFVSILAVIGVFGIYLLKFKSEKKYNEGVKVKLEDNTIIAKEIVKDENDEDVYYITIHLEEGNKKIQVSREVFFKYTILDEYLE